MRLVRDLQPFAWPFVAVVAFIVFSACGSRQVPSELRTGDLLFQDLDCGEMCDAIESATTAQFHVAAPSFSHVGVVVEKNGRIHLLEAYGEAVSLTPIETVLRRPQNAPPRIVRLSDLAGIPADARERIPVIAERYPGRPYDQRFTLGDDAYYCSELVADLFRQLTGRDYFLPTPMRFGDEGSSSRALWQRYFSREAMPVPEGAPGISPLGIWLQATTPITRRAPRSD